MQTDSGVIREYITRISDINFYCTRHRLPLNVHLSFLCICNYYFYEHLLFLYTKSTKAEMNEFEEEDEFISPFL